MSGKQSLLLGVVDRSRYKSLLTHSLKFFKLSFYVHN